MAPTTYLGDSVYIQEHPWSGGVVLMTNNGEPGDPKNVIVLDPLVQAALISYLSHRAKQQSEVKES